MLRWIYIGQFKKGTEISDGIGICVWIDGATVNKLIIKVFTKDIGGMVNRMDMEDIQVVCK